MKTHKNARLTYARRLEMVRSVSECGTPSRLAAAHHGVSLATARKWITRYLAYGAAGLLDQTSRPHRSPRAISPVVAQMILQLRQAGFSMQAIASQVGRSAATVSRVCSAAGLSRFPKPEPQARSPFAIEDAAGLPAR